MTLARFPEEQTASVKHLLALALPALAIGVVSALVLWTLDRVAEGLHVVLWETVPHALGVDPWGWWILLVLTVTGFAVGLGLRFLPGHGGPDSATTELVGPPLRLSTLPGLAVVTVLGLAGGVSLGPENPIIAINASIIVAVLARLMPAVPSQLAMLLAASATIGALFGTPVAAALVFTGIVAALKEGGALWDRLFLPVAAAAAGAITMQVLGAAPLAFDLPLGGAPDWLDLLGGVAVACAATVVALAALALFPLVYRALHALRHPILIPTVGGVLLGLLGMLGGEVTMFKGLAQMGELLEDPGAYDPAQLAMIAGIKILALLVSASALFRGGRVFPAVFIGVALGLLAYALVPSMSIGLTVAAAVIGVVIVITRDGWIAIFLAVAIVGDISILPLLCVIILPAWLLVVRAPEFRIEAPASDAASSDADRTARTNTAQETDR